MCGIFGLASEELITEELLQGLLQLQHRGQDAAGIFTYNPLTKKHYLRKNLGLVSQVFPPELKHYPESSFGIGHVRYATIGKGSVEDSQPHYVKGSQRGIAMAHNGNIVNYLPLRERFNKQGITMNTMCDVEVILLQMANSLGSGPCTFDDICTTVKDIFENTQGSYSCICIIEGVGLVAFRDPHGIRPMLYGYRAITNSHAFASETSSLSILEFDHIQDVPPGEVILIDNSFNIHRRRLTIKKPYHCGFEYTYFAKPNAVLEGKEVYRVRAELGKALAKKVRDAEISADVVVPIPDTSRPAAIALAHELGIPLEEGYVKHGYVGRTFIMPTQAIRKQAVIQKLAPVTSVFRGRNVILTDDSIVRGTVSRKVVALARQAGAQKVYFASTYPPIKHPCLYGVDFPQKDQLIAAEKTMEQICDELNIDGIIYNDLEGFKKALGIQGLCTACITGDYPTALDGLEAFQNMREADLELVCKH